MANERLLLKARLSVKKEELKELETKAENQIIIIRELLDPFEEDFTELEIDNAKVAMDSLEKYWREAKGTKSIIHKMERELGE